jgi:hypothetical protein
MSVFHGPSAQISSCSKLFPKCDFFIFLYGSWTAHRTTTWSAPRKDRGKVTYEYIRDPSRVCPQQFKTVRPIKLSHAVMFLSFVWKVSGLNHGWDTSYSDSGW